MIFKPVALAITLVAFTAIAFANVLNYVFAQDQQNNSDPTTFLQSAKTHLAEAQNSLKNGSSQAALVQINMTHQDIQSAERLLNSTLICNNTDNLGFCATS
jgi:hypothetical protein